MFKLTILLIVVNVHLFPLSLGDDSLSPEYLNEIFNIQSDLVDVDGNGQANGPSKATCEGETCRRCERLAGALDGCFECYFCDDALIRSYRRGNLTVKILKLSSPKCKEFDFCCVNLIETTSVRLGLECGTSNPSGVDGDAQQRKSPKYLLRGEYPWTAHLYKKKNNDLELLCGATFIEEQGKFITTARCVQNKTPSDLVVSFSLQPSSIDSTIAVSSVVAHDKYDAGIGHNDIALITVSQLDKIPRWASPSCLPDAPAPHASYCITIADNNYFVDVVMPLRKLCGEVHESQTCAIAAPDDYKPQHGGGLFCEDQRERKFAIYGIATTNTENDVTTYTDLYHSMKWLNEKLFNK